jgi:site-specific DNA recombinase
VATQEQPVRIAALYARISNEDQSTYSIGNQIKDCEALASREGYSISPDTTCIDEGVSGTILMERPGLQKVLRLADAGTIQAVIVFDPDRLSRRLGHLLYIEERLTRSNVKLRYCGYDRGEGAEGRLMDSVRGAVAEFEREKFLERSVRGKTSRAQAGLPMLGQAIPYGYQYVKATERHGGYLEINPEESKTVMRIFDLRLQGFGSWRIAKILTAERIPTKSDKGQAIREKTREAGTWRPSVISRMLRNETYIGRMAWNKRRSYEPLGPGRAKPKNIRRLKSSSKVNPQDQWIYMACPEIIDKEKFESVQLLMNNHKKTNPRSRKWEYLFLMGRLKCGSCGYGMSGYYNKKRQARISKCSRMNNETTSHCGASVTADTIEEFAWMVVHENVISEPETVIKKLTDRITTVTQQQPVVEADIALMDDGIAKKKQRLRRFQELYADESLTLQEFRERKAEIDRDIASMERVKNEMLGMIGQAKKQQEDLAMATSYVESVSHDAMNIQGIPERRRILELLGVQVAYDHGGTKVSLLLWLPEDLAIGEARNLSTHAS